MLKRRISRMPTRIEGEAVAEPLRTVNFYEFSEGLAFNLLRPTSAGLEYQSFVCTQKIMIEDIPFIAFARRINEEIEVGVFNSNNAFLYQRENKIPVYVALDATMERISVKDGRYQNLNRVLARK